MDKGESGVTVGGSALVLTVKHSEPEPSVCRLQTLQRSGGGAMAYAQPCSRDDIYSVSRDDGRSSQNVELYLKYKAAEEPYILNIVRQLTSGVQTKFQNSG